MSSKKNKHPAPEKRPDQEPNPGIEDIPAAESVSETSAEDQSDVKAAADPVSAESSKWQDRYVRLAAEYDNYRKRTAKERESLYSDATVSTVLSLLPVYDNLERAAHETSTDESYKKGIEMILKQFDAIFEKMGICETPGAGEPFNPDYHDAVVHLEDDALGENVVAEVLQKGFLLKDRVIRHAMVKVAN